MRDLRLLLMLKLLMPVALTLSSFSGSLKIEQALANTAWRLDSISEAGATVPVVEGAAITLKFGADSRAGGSGGCNSYGGQYRVEGESLSFSRIASTRRACADQGAMEQEGRYFRALESAGRFRLSGDRLTIFYNDGEGRLEFTRE